MKSSLLPVFLVLFDDAIVAQSITTKTTTSTSTSTVGPDDIVSWLSDVSGDVLPNMVGFVYTMSSWAASDPCAAQCLSQVGPVTNSNSYELLCSQTSLLAACKSACPHNSHMVSLEMACILSANTSTIASQALPASPGIGLAVPTQAQPTGPYQNQGSDAGLTHHVIPGLLFLLFDLLWV
ncbi:hypothetical protein BC830DRAFT_1162800 [Chytriomyces sp. MP71]|nr:hypothetical protein BC830DRAFT_1162800 [Chytriomyces sp. MP71]